MQIQVFYRTWAGSNDKPRPEWYSRAGCLQSLHVAAANAPCPVRITFVADGGMPRELESLVRQDDEVLRIRAGTAAASLRATVSAAAEAARQSPADLFWLCEDDYLYRPTALAHLWSAATSMPDVDYFSVFSPRPSGWSEAHPSQPDRAFEEIADAPRQVGLLRWARFPCTTSTFGVRAGTLVHDARLLRMGTRPGAPFDGATWHMLQGARPYSWRHIFHDIDAYLAPRGMAKVVGKPVMRVALNVAATRMARHPRVLVTPDVNQAVHVELDEVSGTTEWQQLAEEVLRAPSPKL